MASRQTQENLWLIGFIETELLGFKLPSKREVLKVFFHYNHIEKKTVRESSTIVADMILVFWQKAKIPCKLKRNLIKFIESLVDQYKKLKKNKENKLTRSNKLQEKEDKFNDDLDDLFDIAHQDALLLMTIEEDRLFLLAQREKGRRGFMTSEDIELARMEQQSLVRKEAKVQQEEEEKTRIEKASEIIEFHFSEEEEPTPSTPTVKRARKSVVSPRVASALDRCKVSDREAVFVIAETAQSLGHDIEEYTISRSSIRRHRRKQRAEIAQQLKAELMAHWDGKLLPDMTGNEKVDRLPVLVSGKGVDQLLGVPKIPTSTGQHQAKAVYDILSDWNLCDKVCGECFDTTSSNTGIHNGACVLLERYLGRNILHFGCRHHVHELILEAATVVCLGPSTGPDIALFKRLQDQWSYIDQTAIRPSQPLENTGNYPCLTKEEIIEFAKSQLRQFQPRDDYRELLELCIIFVGGEPERGFHFLRPEALHRARWMAKAIYCLKMYMFRDQLKLTKREEKGLLELGHFITQIYMKAWFTAPNPITAAANDLSLLKRMDKYSDVNLDISKGTVKKLMGQLWYLSVELIPLCLFDRNVANNTKRMIAATLKEDRDEDEEAPKKRAVVYQKDIQRRELEDFASPNSINFFEYLRLTPDFLQVEDPNEWETEESFVQIRSIVSQLRVVNDNAERGVALMTEYNKLITYDEEQKQYLLQVVTNHRRTFPDCKKSTLMISVNEPNKS